MTEEIKNQSVHGIIIRIAVFLTLGVLFSLIIWIWKSESLSSINIYDGFLLLAAITVTGILAMLYFRYWKTGGQHDLFYSVPFLLGIWLFLILPVGSLAYLATSPGYYDYRE